MSIWGYYVFSLDSTTCLPRYLSFLSDVSIAFHLMQTNASGYLWESKTDEHCIHHSCLRGQIIWYLITLYICRSRHGDICDLFFIFKFIAHASHVVTAVVVHNAFILIPLSLHTIISWKKEIQICSCNLTIESDNLSSKDLKFKFLEY